MSTTAGTRARRRAKPTFGQRARAVVPPVGAALLLGLALVLPDGSDDDRAPGPVTVARSAYACPGGPGVSVAAGQVVAGRSATARSLTDGTSVDSLDGRDPMATRRDRW